MNEITAGLYIATCILALVALLQYSKILSFILGLGLLFIFFAPLPNAQPSNPNTQIEFTRPPTLAPLQELNC